MRVLQGSNDPAFDAARFDLCSINYGGFLVISVRELAGSLICSYHGAACESSRFAVLLVSLLLPSRRRAGRSFETFD